jgi:hypothetical protein
MIRLSLILVLLCTNLSIASIVAFTTGSNDELKYLSMASGKITKVDSDVDKFQVGDTHISYTMNNDQLKLYNVESNSSAIIGESAISFRMNNQLVCWIDKHFNMYVHYFKDSTSHFITRNSSNYQIGGSLVVYKDPGYELHCFNYGDDSPSIVDYDTYTYKVGNDIVAYINSKARLVLWDSRDDSYVELPHYGRNFSSISDVVLLQKDNNVLVMKRNEPTIMVGTDVDSYRIAPDFFLFQEESGQLNMFNFKTGAESPVADEPRFYQAAENTVTIIDRQYGLKVFSFETTSKGFLSDPELPARNVSRVLTGKGMVCYTRLSGEVEVFDAVTGSVYSLGDDVNWLELTGRMRKNTKLEELGNKVQRFQHMWTTEQKSLID